MSTTLYILGILTVYTFKYVICFYPFLLLLRWLSKSTCSQATCWNDDTHICKSLYYSTRHANIWTIWFVVIWFLPFTFNLSKSSNIHQIAIFMLGLLAIWWVSKPLQSQLFRDTCPPKQPKQWSFARSRATPIWIFNRCRWSFFTPWRGTSRAK